MCVLCFGRDDKVEIIELYGVWFDGTGRLCLVVRRDYNPREGGGEILLSNTWKKEDGFEEECRLEIGCGQVSSFW